MEAHRNTRIDDIIAYLIAALLLIFMVSGCNESYVTPSKGANLTVFQSTDVVASDQSGASGAVSEPVPMAEFPVHLAVARIQMPCDSYYYADQVSTYAVASVRDVESGSDVSFEALEGIAQIVPINHMLLGGQQKDPDMLRRAAASLKAQMVFVYTLDTRLSEEDWSSPISIATLGMAPTVTTRVTTTASGVLLDTQTGYVYGAVEATSSKSQKAAFLTRENAWDQCQRQTEKQAYEKLFEQFKAYWKDVYLQYAKDN